MTKVTAMYKYDGKIDLKDNEECLLLPNGTILSVADGNFGIYSAKETETPGVVLIDLDDVTTDLGLSSNPEMLIDILALG
ncbi:hypothetical protein HRF69_03215 [Bacillus circulans]|uniref:hypothetical protein n=1 Tax=Niallia circulans TaxID=1397 RepID=UPI0015617D0E|nr:hypothetical protein [Niallia circulans]NRG26125.1 hypothetical protein [Niallia circulans]